MNARRMMNKLVLAINLRGRRVKINQVQKYSERCGRMVTKYMVMEERFQPKTGKRRYVSVLESRQASEVVQALADMLNSTEAQGHGPPDEKERLRAAELLGKRYGLYTDRIEQEFDMDLTTTVDYWDDAE